MTTNAAPQYTEITCETAAQKLKRRIPYGWDLNAYRGCAHGCRYCYAQGTHAYLDSQDFSGEIYVKTNIAEALERQLASPNWKREVINLGGVTDSYQPAEATYKLMPDILRLLIKYKTPAIISTKSELVLRDFDLIDQLSRITYINVAASVITVDEALAQKLEPGAAAPAKRLAMLKTFSRTQASIGLHCMPIIPYITDGAKNFDTLFALAADANVSYVLPGTLYLRGAAKPAFLSFVQREFPELHEKLTALYKTGGAGKEYKEELYQTVNALRDKYKLSSSYSKPMKEKLAAAAEREREEEGEQLTFLK